MTKQIGKFRLTVNPEAAASIHDDGIVILHVGKGRVFSANRTGARIWRGIERELPLETIAAEISSEYRIPEATAHEHAAGFLAELERHALVQRGSAS
jgi:hypothetical protein